MRVAALTPAADAVPLAKADLAGQRVALLLGAEGPGLSDAALAAADVRVRIPMAAGVDSLNVATAAAVAFHAIVAPVG
jgi:tRNA G18 (ribose-2'-O)-methylase SpoU